MQLHNGIVFYFLFKLFLQAVTVVLDTSVADPAQLDQIVQREGPHARHTLIPILLSRGTHMSCSVDLGRIQTVATVIRRL